MKKIMMFLITGLAVAQLTAGSPAAEDMGVNIHGFVSQGYLSTTENNFVTDSKDGTFEFNETGINFGRELTDNLRFGLQLFARDFGDQGNNEIKLDWAYADYRIGDWMGIRFGQLKAPHGLYNETRDVDMLRNAIFLPQSVYQEIMRDATLSLQGAGIYGYLDMNAAGGLSYQAMYGTQYIAPNNKMAEALTGIYSTALVNIGFDVDYKYAASLVWDSPLPGLRVGVTNDNVKFKVIEEWVIGIPGISEPGDLAYADYKKLENWVVSAEYTWKNLMLMAEFMQTYKEYDLGTFTDLESEPYAWYVGAVYRFTDWFELGAYYSQTENDAPDIGRDIPDFYHELNEICVSARFDVNEFLSFKIEGHSFQGAYGLSSFDNENRSPNPAIDDYFEEDWTLFAAKLTVAF